MRRLLLQELKDLQKDPPTSCSAGAPLGPCAVGSHLKTLAWSSCLRTCSTRVGVCGSAPGKCQNSWMHMCWRVHAADTAVAAEMRCSS